MPQRPGSQATTGLLTRQHSRPSFVGHLGPSGGPASAEHHHDLDNGHIHDEHDVRDDHHNSPVPKGSLGGGESTWCESGGEQGS